MRRGVRGGDADKIFVDARFHQFATIGLIGETRAMGLDAHMFKAVIAGPARQVRQIGPQRHFRPGEGEPSPSAFMGVL